MHPQLVGAPREGIESHAGLAAAARQDLEARDGGFAVCRAHHLPWAVVRVGAEGKTDKAFVVRYRTVEQSDVPFLMCRVSNSCCNCRCVSGSLAMRSTPEVSMSRRCTKSGPVASGKCARAQLHTEGASPLPGTESMPAGLLTATIHSSS